MALRESSSCSPTSYNVLSSSQFTRMPLLDKLTIKNPIILYLQRTGILPAYPNPLRPVVSKHFHQRKAIWQASNEKDAQAQEQETLVDKFLTVDRDNPEKLEMKPETSAMMMVVAGSETS